MDYTATSHCPTFGNITVTDTKLSEADEKESAVFMLLFAYQLCQISRTHSLANSNFKWSWKNRGSLDRV